MTDPQTPPPVEGEQPPQPAPELEPLPPPPPERTPFWSYLDLVLLVLLAFPLLLLSPLLIGGVVAALHRTLPKVAFLLAAQFLFYAFWFLLLFQIIRLRYGRAFWPSLGWVRTRYPFWTYAGWGFAIAIFCAALSALLPRTHIKIPLEELLQDRSSILLMGAFAVSLGPLAEELAFRGFLMPLLVRSFGAAGGVLLQALPFALLHGPEYGWAWQQLIVMFLAGAAFGVVRHHTGSTAASTYAHAAFNLTAVAGALAQSSH
jgi:uncharacterized protein